MQDNVSLRSHSKKSQKQAYDTTLCVVGQGGLIKGPNPTWNIVFALGCQSETDSEIPLLKTSQALVRGQGEIKLE